MANTVTSIGYVIHLFFYQIKGFIDGKIKFLNPTHIRGVILTLSHDTNISLSVIENSFSFV